MSIPKPLNPGETQHIWSPPDHLTQVQHRIDRIDIVDHFDHGRDAVDYHHIMHIDKDGNLDIDY
jgi:hypothetical protein